MEDNHTTDDPRAQVPRLTSHARGHAQQNTILWNTKGLTPHSTLFKYTTFLHLNNLTDMIEPVTINCQLSHDHEAWRVRQYDEHSVATVRRSNRQVSHVSRTGTQGVKFWTVACFAERTVSHIPNPNFRLCFLRCDWNP